jgi:radical SAM enzyme (TIGR01210 family)
MIDLNFGTVHDYTQQLRDIRDWAQRLRRLRPRVETTWREPADWVVKDANIHGSPVKTLTITLTPTGCEWASTGGCTMCGEFEGSTKSETIPAMFHIAQFASAVSKYVAEHNPAWIRIYQEGNYTNQHEIDNSAQFTILRLASLIGGIRRITIESMAKYLTRKNVQYLSRAIARDVELEVGMGFEGENDVVRNVCINKGESINDFRKAVGLLREMGIRSLAYVLLKPPFLSEGEAIEEAIATIQLAHEIGFDAVSLEPVSIHGYTLVHALSIEGLYQLPWLWSVVRVAQSAHQIRDFRIGGVGFYPRPVNVAHNRHLDLSDGCNKAFWAAIKDYGKSRRIDVFESLDCTCKKEWEEACQSVEAPLRTRIEQQLSHLDFDRYARVISEGPLVRQPVVSYTTAVAGGTQYLAGCDGRENGGSGSGL